MRCDDMDIAKSVKELRESTGMSCKEFSVHTGIPVRTLEDCDANGKLFLYDIVQIKKETSTPLE